MKKYILLLLVCLVMSCSDSYLDKTPDEDMSLEMVFQERNYAEAFLSNIYSYLPLELTMAWHSWMGWDLNLNPFVGAADEMEMSWNTPYNQFMNSGAWSPADAGTGTPAFWWWYYEAIRKTNLFLENIHKTPMNEVDKNKWIGEAYFMRAFYHFMLFRVYGPIPLLDRSISTDEDFTNFVRRPIEEVVSFILNDCEKAYPLLDIKVTSDKYGRITSAAVLALKARLLLYAASPLYNGNPDYVDFKNAEGENFFPINYNKQKWRIAANAAKDCIDKTEAAGYRLYYSASQDPFESYSELFLVRHNSEILFARNSGEGYYFEQLCSASGQGGWSGLNPTQNLVDAYEMQSNGLRPIIGYDGTVPIINSESKYVEEGFTSEAHPKGYYPAGTCNMYVGRDPRFYASVNFNGQQWRGRQLEFFSTGLDRGAGPDFPSTGYLSRKYSDEAVNIPQGRWTLKTWIFFRLGELYLNYAEALNEIDGPIDDVYTYINAIRKRAGMPALPKNLTQDEMRERIRHERRIELAFETHRYFDCHRWKIAEETDNGPILGLSRHLGTSLQDNTFYTRMVIETRVFDAPKHYLWPLQQYELDRVPWLIQNPKW